MTQDALRTRGALAIAGVTAALIFSAVGSWTSAARDLPVSSSTAAATQKGSPSPTPGAAARFATPSVGETTPPTPTPTPTPTEASPSGSPSATGAGITTPALPKVAPVASSGVAVPIGNLPGWNQVFVDDFRTPVTMGGFPGSGYSSKWLSYDNFYDTSHAGWYDKSIISAHDGVLDLYLHTQNGVALGAAPVPLVGGKWGGQTYGRFSVRMRADPLPGYGTGFLLWNDSGNWTDGEIDFPENGLTGTAKGFNHCVGAPQNNCLVVTTNTTMSSWHTYTIEWTPAELRYIIDGAVVGSTTTSIPNQKLHWVMQVATTGVAPPATAAGHLLIDWATIYSYAP